MPRPRKADQLAVTASECDEQVVHVEAVRLARAGLPAGERLSSLAALFAALGDPTRLRILAALAGQELCVCDLAATVGQSESAVSHQLRALRGLGLVHPRREGRRVYYGLDDTHVTAFYAETLNHVGHRPTGGVA